MKNVVMYHGNKIAFVAGITKTNGLTESLSNEMLVTSVGFLMPLSPSAFNVLDHLEGTVVPNAKYFECYTAAVVDAQGVVREYYVDPEGAFATRRPTGPNFKGSCSRWLEAEEVATSCLELTDTIEEAVDLYCTKTGEHRHHFRIMEMKDIVKLLSGE
jgi:hypothetical protein